MSTKQRTGNNSKKSSHIGYVRKETVISIAIICLFLGYIIGIFINPTSISTGNSSGNNQDNQSQNTTTQQQNSNIIEDLLEKTKSDPDSAQAWIRLGNEYYDIGDHENAVSAYTKSLQIDSSNANVWTDLGVMYRRLGNPEKAIESFDRAISADPTHEQSLFNKGIVLSFDLLKKDEAIVVWRELLKKNSSFATPTGQLLSDFIKDMEK